MADIKKAKYNEPGVFDMYEDDMWSIPYYASKMQSQLMPYGSNGNIETKPIISQGIDQIKGYIENIQQTFESMIRDNIYDVVKDMKKSDNWHELSEKLYESLEGFIDRGEFGSSYPMSIERTSSGAVELDIWRIGGHEIGLKFEIFTTKDDFDDAFYHKESGFIVNIYRTINGNESRYVSNERVEGGFRGLASYIRQYVDDMHTYGDSHVPNTYDGNTSAYDMPEEFYASTRKMKKSNIKRVISKIVEYGRMSDVQKSKIAKDYNGWTNYETWAFATYEMDEINTFINDNIERGQYKSDSDIMNDISSCIDSVIDDMYEEADGLRSGAMRDIATMGVKRIDDNDIKMAIWRDVGPNFDRYMETDKSTKKSKTESFNAMVNNIRVKNNSRKV